MHCHLHRGDWNFHLTNEKKKSHWYDSTPKKSRRKRDSNSGSSALEVDAFPLGQRGGRSQAERVCWLVAGLRSHAIGSHISGHGQSLLVCWWPKVTRHYSHCSPPNMGVPNSLY